MVSGFLEYSVQSVQAAVVAQKGGMGDGPVVRNAAGTSCCPYGSLGGQLGIMRNRYGGNGAFYLSLQVTHVG